MARGDFNNITTTPPLISLYDKNAVRDGIRIAAPYGGSTTTYLELRNQSQKWAAFRLKCTHPKHFTVKPRSTGLIAAKGCQEIRLSLLPTYSSESNYRLLIDTTFIPQTHKVSGNADKNEVLAIWNETNKADIASTRFPIQIFHMSDDSESPKLIVCFDEPQSISRWMVGDDDYFGQLMKLTVALYRNETFFSSGLILLLLICQCFFLYFSFTMTFLS